MHLASSPPGQRCLYPSSTTVPDIMYAAMATWNVPFDTPVEWGPSQGAPSSGNVEWGRRMGQHASASNGTSTKCQSGWRSDPIKRGMSKSNHQPRLLQDRSHDPNPLTQEGGGHCCKTASMTLPSCRVRMAKAYGWAVGPVPRLQALSFGPYAKSSGFGASRARPGSMGPGLRPSGRMPDARRLALGRPVREA